jgi:hypothetical protein
MVAYPDAKVLLTVRSSSEAVCKSMFDTIYRVGSVRACRSGRCPRGLTAFAADARGHGALPVDSGAPDAGPRRH